MTTQGSFARRWLALVLLVVAVVFAQAPAHAESSISADSRASCYEVHTYFVSGREGAPAVWVHNASIFERVKYGASRLSKIAKDYRLARRAGALKGRNLVVAEFLNKAGERVTKTFKSIPGGWHSEEVMHRFFMKQGISAKNVFSVYSEFEPCVGSGPRNICRTLLESIYGESKISYSFPYVGEDARQIGRAMKRGLGF